MQNGSNDQVDGNNVRYDGEIILCFFNTVCYYIASCNTLEEYDFLDFFV